MEGLLMGDGFVSFEDAEYKPEEKEWTEPCPVDCIGGLCDDCIEDDEYIDACDHIDPKNLAGDGWAMIYGIEK